MIEIREAMPHDYLNLNVHPAYAEFDPDVAKRNCFLRGYVASVNDEILGIYGFTPIMPGVVEAWSITTPLVAKYPKEYIKHMRLVFKELLNLYHRVQTTVSVDFHEAVRCNEHLGFVCEGVMRKYGPLKTDFYLFGRTK